MLPLVCWPPKSFLTTSSSKERISAYSTLSTMSEQGKMISKTRNVIFLCGCDVYTHSVAQNVTLSDESFLGSDFQLVHGLQQATWERIPKWAVVLYPFLCIVNPILLFCPVKLTSHTQSSIGQCLRVSTIFPGGRSSTRQAAMETSRCC